MSTTTWIRWGVHTIRADQIASMSATYSKRKGASPTGLDVHYYEARVRLVSGETLVRGFKATTDPAADRTPKIAEAERDAIVAELHAALGVDDGPPMPDLG